MIAGWRKNGLPGFAGLALLWIVLVVLANPIGDYPANDDWVYGLAVQAILRDGGAYSLSSASLANFVLQGYWGALFCLPFGFSYTALRISTLVLGLIGGAAGYGMARELGGDRRIALVVAGSLMLNPLYFQLSSSFMTDVPFVAITSLSLWSLLRGLLRPSRPAMVAAFVLALASIMIRQFGLIFVVAYGVALVVRDRFSLRSLLILLGTTALGLAGHFGFQHWLAVTHRTPRVLMSAVSDIVPHMDGAALATLLLRMLVLPSYLGVMLLPIYLATGFRSVAAALRRRPRTASAIALLLIVAQIVAWRVTHIRMPLLGNSLNLWGMGPLTLRDTYILSINLPPEPRLAGAVWMLLFLIGMTAGALLFVELICALITLIADRRNAGRDGVSRAIDAAVLSVVGFYVALLALLGGGFDRYLLVIVPLLSFWIVAKAGPAPAGRGWRGAAITVLVAFGLFALVTTHDYLAWQRARLAATGALARAGIPPARVDGGYEYNGSHLYNIAYRPKPGRSYWWVADDSYIVASGPLPGYRIAARYPYRRWLTMTASEVVILRRAKR